MDALPFDSPADEFCGTIRTQLGLAGTSIGGNDLLIAAQALALDHTLVTDQGVFPHRWIARRELAQGLTRIHRNG
jgi:predicted nucleic acid-binding protein